MELTTKELKNLYKVGMEGIVADINSPYRKNNSECGFPTGAKIKIVDNASIGLLRCENEEGVNMMLFSHEILITKINQRIAV